jgi:hypothetical protein
LEAHVRGLVSDLLRAKMAPFYQERHQLGLRQALLTTFETPLILIFIFGAKGDMYSTQHLPKQWSLVFFSISTYLRDSTHSYQSQSLMAH